MRKLAIYTAALISLAGVTSACQKVEQSALSACISEFKALGISPDAALKECKQKSLAECIQGLLGGNFVAQAVDKDPKKGYLIDLGNNQSRWMEGEGWRKFNCVGEEDGPQRVEATGAQGGLIFDWRNTSKEFYRNGWCQTESIEIDQPITREEAKLQCEIGNTTQISQEDEIKP